VTEHTISPRMKADLADRAIEILEKMAFFLADHASDDQEELVSDALLEAASVTIDFQGPFSGTLQLCAPMETCGILAANILGLNEDEVVSPERAGDALKEVANVLAGNLLSELCGREKEIGLSVPGFSIVNPLAWREIEASPLCIRLTSMDGPMLVNFKLHRGQS